MAVYRESPICPRCGKPWQAKYQDQSDRPWYAKTIGDTFVGWKDHKCNLFDVLKHKLKS